MRSVSFSLQVEVKMDKTYLVTGAGGRLGNRFVHVLCKNNIDKVKKLTLFDLKFNDDVKAEQQRVCQEANIDAQWLTGDIVDADTVDLVVTGVDVVLHMAAIIDFNHSLPEKTLWDVNYKGTLNVLEACRRQNVGYLVYTSTNEVVGPNSDMKPMHIGDEETEYEFKPMMTYAKTKRKAEETVLAANKERCDVAHDKNLITCALRSPGIYGGNDPILEYVIKDAGKQKILVNPAPETALHERAYVDNVAWAHVLAAHVIQKKHNIVGGNAYFIGDNTPRMSYQRLNHVILEPFGYKISDYVPSYWFLYIVAIIQTFIAKVFSLFGKEKKVGILTVHVVKMARTAFTCSHEKFKDHFSYKPLLSWEQCLKQTRKDVKRFADEIDEQP